ncbi:hypothetical protein [Microseira sp. BLCC-F43]|uniref:hypothetical protein n=1 Tax=Microseira sp. BLCC-F43 TaxID=3153602 RepID=UPI0035B888F5
MSDDLELILEKKQLELWESNDYPLFPPKLSSYEKELAYYQQKIASHGDQQSVAHVGDLSEVVVPPVGSRLLEAEFCNWGDVASTIYNFILRTTGFDPSSVDAQTNEFRDFLNMFATAPHWNGLDFGIQHRDVNIYCQNYTEAVNAVSDMLGDFMGETARKRVIESIKKAAELAAKSGGPENKNVLFKNGVISGNQNGLYVFIMYSFVTMIQVQPGKHNVLPQELRVVAAHGLLNTDFCNRNAEAIIKFGKMTLDEWENLTAAANKQPNTSPGWFV